MAARDDLREAGQQVLIRANQLWDKTLSFHWSLFPEEKDKLDQQGRDWAAYMRMRRMRERARLEGIAAKLNPGKTSVVGFTDDSTDDYGIFAGLFGPADAIKLARQELGPEVIDAKAKSLREQALAIGRLDLFAGVTDRAEVILRVLALLHGTQNGYLCFEQEDHKRIWVIPI